MTPDEAIETLREAIGPRDLPHLGPTSGWAQHAETLHRERHEALDRMASLARDHADLLDWAAKAAGVLRAMLSTLGDYATVEEMNETRFADLRGYMVEAETGLLEALLAEHAERWGNT